MQTPPRLQKHRETVFSGDVIKKSYFCVMKIIIHFSNLCILFVFISCTSTRSQGDGAPVFDTREHPLPDRDSDTVTPTPVGSGTELITTYIVQRGDTLFSISRAHGMTVQELQELNGLTSTNIQAGQSLLVRSRADEGSPSLKRQTTIHDLPTR